MPFSVARDETGKCFVNYKILGVKSADSVYNIPKQIRQQMNAKRIKYHAFEELTSYSFRL